MDEDDVLRKKLISFVADAADLDNEDIDPKADFYVDYDVDSLGIVTIFVDITDEFGIEGPDDDADWKALNTVEALLRYVKSRT